MSNNMISLGEDVSNDVQIQGIRQDNTVGSGLTLLYNSVFIGGTDDGPVNYSAGFDRMVTTPVTVKDNLFYNARTGSGTHLAIANTATSPFSGWFPSFSDNNFFVSVSGTAVGRWGGSDYSFSGWQSVTGGCDPASVSKLTPTETQPANFFINTATGDLSVNVANAGEASLAQNIGVPVSVTTDFFGTARSAGTPDPGAHEFATVVPVELESFTGKVLKISNMLQWSTASERNVQWHFIDRSDDGIQSWMQVGKLNGKGDSQTRQNYQFEDLSPGTQSFYRLRTVDFNGREQLSNIIALTRQDDNFGISAIFPNPATATIYIQFSAPEEDELSVLVTDMTGRIVIEQKTAAVSGINVLDILLAQLSAGTYFIKVQSNNSVSEQVRFVKQ